MFLEVGLDKINLVWLYDITENRPLKSQSEFLLKEMKGLLLFM